LQTTPVFADTLAQGTDRQAFWQQILKHHASDVRSQRAAMHYVACQRHQDRTVASVIMDGTQKLAAGGAHLPEAVRVTRGPATSSPAPAIDTLPGSVSECRKAEHFSLSFLTTSHDRRFMKREHHERFLKLRQGLNLQRRVSSLAENTVGFTATKGLVT